MKQRDACQRNCLETVYTLVNHRWQFPSRMHALVDGLCNQITQQTSDLPSERHVRRIFTSWIQLVYRKSKPYRKIKHYCEILSMCAWVVHRYFFWLCWFVFAWHVVSANLRCFANLHSGRWTYVLMWVRFALGEVSLMLANANKRMAD